MSSALLQHASAPPAGWRVTLITEPSKPARICLNWQMPDGGYLQHQITLGYARWLAASLARACDYLVMWTAGAPSFFEGCGSPVNVWVGGRKGRKPVQVDFSANHYPLEVHTASYRFTPESARRLANALTELLVLLDPPRSELPADCDPNPERFIPEYLRAHAGTPTGVPA